MPPLRRRRSGRGVNLSSIGGLVGLPGDSTYNARPSLPWKVSREALALEVAPLGGRVTLVEPGAFRTDFLGRSLVMAKETIDDYADTSGKTRAAAGPRHGNQAGEPVRGGAGDHRRR